jgi:hypothetical protein
MWKSRRTSAGGCAEGPTLHLLARQGRPERWRRDVRPTPRTMNLREPWGENVSIGQVTVTRNPSAARSRTSGYEAVTYSLQIVH